MRQVLLPWSAVLALGGCEVQESRQSATLFDANAGERIFATVAYDTVWVYGGPGDTILSLPAMPLAAPDGGLYVFDLQDQRLLRLTATGSLRWAWGRRGQGPGEVLNVRAMALGPDGSVVLADSGNRRLVTVASDGRTLHEVPLPTGIVHVEAIDVLSSGAYVLKVFVTSTDDRSAPWAIVSRDGHLLGAPSVPWEGFAQRASIELTGHLVATSRDDRWIFGFGTGNGWFVFDSLLSVGTHPYVEHTDFPVSVSQSDGNATRTSFPTRPIVSANSLAVRQDTLIVLFGGLTSDRYRVLDKYDIESGSYLSSLRLPHSAIRFAVGPDHTVFTIDVSGVFPTIVALRVKAQ